MRLNIAGQTVRSPALGDLGPGCSAPINRRQFTCLCAGQGGKLSVVDALSNKGATPLIDQQGDNVITASDIEAADEAVKTARRTAQSLEATSSPDGLRQAEQNLTRALQKAAELREQLTAQNEALRRRKAAERAVSADLKGMDAELRDAADMVALAAREAEQALLRLAGACAARNGVVAAVHERLKTLDLPLDEPAVRHETSGWGTDGSVMVKGEHHRPTQAEAVTAHVVSKLAAAEFGSRSELAGFTNIRMRSMAQAGGLLVQVDRRSVTR